jgi:GNAT superfamily N-acetyltransferase
MVDGFYLSDQNKDMDVNAIHDFIGKSYWAEGIPYETMSKAINNSLCFGVFTNECKQVGFARVVTDHVTFAYLCDVYILEEYRGIGLSKWLMEFVHKHPSLNGLRRTALVTRDAQTLYERFGYTTLNNPAGYMEKWFPNVYKSS